PCPSHFLLPFYLPYSPPTLQPHTSHLPHTPNYLSIYPSIPNLIPHTTSPNPSPSHPSQPHLTISSCFPYFPSLLVIPDSHSSEPLFTQSPIVSPNHPPLILLPLSS